MSVVLQIEIVEPDHDSSDSDYERKITLPQQCDRLPARGEIIEGVHLVKEDGLIRVLLCSEPEAAGHPRYQGAGDRVAADGLLGFELEERASLDEAMRIAQLMNDKISSLSLTRREATFQQQVT